MSNHMELYGDFAWMEPAPAGAHLAYGGGPLLGTVKLFGVFINDPNGTDFPYPAQMSGFLSWIASSDILTSLVEYNVSGKGSHTGDATLSLSGPNPPPPPPPGGDCSAELNALIACLGYASPSSPISATARGSLDLPHRKFAGTVVQDADLQSLLASAISAGSLPLPDSETLFVVYLPDSVTVQIGSDASCTTFCGYHNAFALPDGSPVYYAILPFPSCAGCQGGMTAFDALTTITTHEVAEAVTDPAADGSGWYDPANGEDGDIFAWMERSDGGYEVQLLWSNKRNSCV